MCSNLFKTCSNVFKCVQTCSKLVKMCSNVLKCVQMCSNLYKTCSNVFKCVEMCSNMFKLVQKLFKCIQMCSNVFELVQNLFKCVQTCLKLVQTWNPDQLADLSSPVWSCFHIFNSVRSNIKIDLHTVTTTFKSAGERNLWGKSFIATPHIILAFSPFFL